MMQPEKKAEWYEDWFDSPYYSILYKHRDDQEARSFIDALLSRIQPPGDACILDLACGRGRFSRYLAEQGYEVTGLDLSESSITYARQFETARLSFFTHDMRLPYRINYFDCIFSFFTSFGYFNTDAEHQRMLKSVHAGLKPGGIFVLDFFNAHHVRKQLPAAEEKTLDGIHFYIDKREESPFVTKTIRFEDNGHRFFFKEKVQLYECDALKDLFSKAGLREIDCWGDYSLNPFDKAGSPRLILAAQKA